MIDDSTGDVDPEFNVVEVTEEAKQELAKIDNKIGDYICCLCKEVYGDAFGLAQHRWASCTTFASFVFGSGTPKWHGQKLLWLIRLMLITFKGG